MLFFAGFVVKFEYLNVPYAKCLKLFLAVFKSFVLKV